MVRRGTSAECVTYPALAPKRTWGTKKMQGINNGGGKKPSAGRQRNGNGSLYVERDAEEADKYGREQGWIAPRAKQEAH